MKPVLVPMSIAGRDIPINIRLTDLSKTKKSVVKTELLRSTKEVHLSYDPSIPEKIISVYASPNPKEIEKAIQCAVDDPKGWRNKGFKKYFEILQKSHPRI